jgi:outer membrane protein assembly factor BamB
MKKWIVVLLIFGAALVASGDTLLTVAWDNLVQRGGPQKRNEATSVALHHNRAVVGAVLGRVESSETDVVIRGFNLTTGTLVWTDEFPGFDVFVEAAHDFAIAVATIPLTNNQNLRIRSYDLHSGATRWTTDTALVAPQKILIRNGKLVIVGYDPDIAPLHGVILVLDASTGAPLWNTEIDIPGSESELWDVDDAGKNIVVVGTKDTVSENARDLILRSYRLRDGQLRWEAAAPGVFASAIRVQNDLVYIAGFERVGSATIGFLAAYHLGDGIQQWKAPPPSIPGLGLGLIRLAVTPTAVIAGRFGGLEAHDPFNGNLLWSQALQQESLQRLIPIDDHLLTVGAKTIPGEEDRQLILRVLDSAGNVVAEHLGETGPGNSYRDAALLNNRFAVVGHLGGIAGGALVRVYDVQIGIQP